MALNVDYCDVEKY